MTVPSLRRRRARTRQSAVAAAQADAVAEQTRDAEAARVTWAAQYPPQFDYLRLDAAVLDAAADYLASSADGSESSGRRSLTSGLIHAKLKLSHPDSSAVDIQKVMQRAARRLLPDAGDVRLSLWGYYHGQDDVPRLARYLALEAELELNPHRKAFDANGVSSELLEMRAEFTGKARRRGRPYPQHDPAVAATGPLPQL
jgi:hypothetical protein